MEYLCPRCLQLTTNLGLCNTCKRNEVTEAQEAEANRLKKWYDSLPKPTITDEEREAFFKQFPQEPIVTTKPPPAYVDIRRCIYRGGRCKFKPSCTIFEECWNHTHTKQLTLFKLQREDT